MQDNLNRTPSKNHIYLNQQNIKKNKNTIFHSPYKGGKKNLQYNNPTFMSSELFYAQQSVEGEGQKYRKAIVSNVNDIRKKQLYTQRMQKSHSFINLRSTSKIQNNKNNINTNKCNLERELQTLINSNRRRKNRCKNTDNRLPIYFQKSRQHCKQQQKIIKQRDKLKEWININKQIKVLKQQQKNHNKQQERQAIKRRTKLQKQNYCRRQQESRRNASLLSKILQQQIQNTKINFQ